MCIICLELEKMTWPEAVNNLYEMAPTLDRDHAKEIGVQLAMDLFDNLGAPEFEEQMDDYLFTARATQLFDLLEKLEDDDFSFDLDL